MSRSGILIIAVYSHPEYLPPTLNAIEHLSGKFEHIYVVHRNVFGFDWVYPPNVTLLSSGKPLTVREAEKKPVFQKIKAFLGFSALICKTYQRTRSRALLIYDPMPLLSYRLARMFIRKPALLWYHNHDVAENQYLRKWSLYWFAWKTEKWVFPRLNVFSLPALERQACFPMDLFRGEFFFLPNFPSKKIYKDPGPKSPNDVIKILFQGSIGPEHGLEEIIAILKQSIAGKQLQLVLKGFISEEYRRELEQLARQYDALDKLMFIGPSGYKEVIENAFSCHIGIGIHRKADMMNKTLGTASNKIYEYAAAGMPVILFDNPHFRSHLQQFEWTFFSDCSKNSLVQCIEAISSGYEALSRKARADFEKGLHFELFFGKVVSFLDEKNMPGV